MRFTFAQAVRRAAPVIFLSVFLPVAGWGQETGGVAEETPPEIVTERAPEAVGEAAPEIAPEPTEEIAPEIAAEITEDVAGHYRKRRKTPPRKMRAKPMMKAASGRFCSTRAALSHGLSPCCRPLACPLRRLNLCSFCAWKSGAPSMSKPR